MTSLIEPIIEIIIRTFCCNCSLKKKFEFISLAIVARYKIRVILFETETLPRRMHSGDCVGGIIRDDVATER